MTNQEDGIDPTETAASPPTETQEHTPAPSGAGVPKRIGQYRIKRAIASGGMGTVYEALQEKPRRTVAVKLMRAGRKLVTMPRIRELTLCAIRSFHAVAYRSIFPNLQGSLLVSLLRGVAC